LENAPGNNNGNSIRKKRLALGLLGAIVVCGALAALIYGRYLRTHISTDDAYIEAAIHTIASELPGRVLNVPVAENQVVSEGELLVRLDPKPFEEGLKEAEANLEKEKKHLDQLAAARLSQDAKVKASEATLARVKAQQSELDAAVAAREAEVKLRQASLSQAERELKRAEELYSRGLAAEDVRDRARTARDTAIAALENSERLADQARATRAVQDSVIAEAGATLAAVQTSVVEAEEAVKSQKGEVRRQEAFVEMARLDLSHTEIRAPESGRVTKKNVEIGNVIQPGQPLMTIVPLQGFYVMANYKETKVSRIRQGQPVEIRLDAYPGARLKGRVESVMAGTGSAFALFPPENASGNFVKVVQRVPVKIVFEGDLPADTPLRVGMSVIPTVLAGDP